MPDEEYTVATYGDRIAGVYDAWVGVPADTADTVEFLAGLAGRGPALELGIGTGRVALPLVARGVEVHGIDASVAMVSKLRRKPGGEAIPVTVGDFADPGPPGGPYALVFVVFNTFFGLLSQDDQVRCFAGVAACLAPGGSFVIEAFVPDLTRFDRGQRVSALRVEGGLVQLEVTLNERAAQRNWTQHVMIDGEGTRFYPVQIRYAWPAELDLMARLAGMRLRERWGGWRREPFGPQSQNHVSVYELDAGRR